MIHLIIHSLRNTDIDKEDSTFISSFTAGFLASCVSFGYAMNDYVLVKIAGEFLLTFSHMRIITRKAARHLNSFSRQFIGSIIGGAMYQYLGFEESAAVSFCCFYYFVFFYFYTTIVVIQIHGEVFIALVSHLATTDLLIIFLFHTWQTFLLLGVTIIHKSTKDF